MPTVQIQQRFLWSRSLTSTVISLLEKGRSGASDSDARTRITKGPMFKLRYL